MSGRLLWRLSLARALLLLLPLLVAALAAAPSLAAGPALSSYFAHEPAGTLSTAEIFRLREVKAYALTPVALLALLLAFVGREILSAGAFGVLARHEKTSLLPELAAVSVGRVLRMTGVAFLDLLLAALAAVTVRWATAGLTDHLAAQGAALYTRIFWVQLPAGLLLLLAFALIGALGASVRGLIVLDDRRYLLRIYVRTALALAARPVELLVQAGLRVLAPLGLTISLALWLQLDHSLGIRLALLPLVAVAVGLDGLAFAVQIARVQRFLGSAPTLRARPDRPLFGRRRRSFT
jgi:hypothetical protein